MIRDSEIRARILVTLKGSPVNNITDIAKNAKTTRITARKHLAKLTEEGLVVEHHCGRNRIFSLCSTCAPELGVCPYGYKNRRGKDE